MNLYYNRVGTLGTENAFKIGDDIRRCKQMGKKVIKLNLGEPDLATGLAERDNVVLLLHLGSATQETRAKMATGAATNALVLLK